MRLKELICRPGEAPWLEAARWLLLAEFAAIFISTSLVSVVEILLFLTVLVCAVKYRTRLTGALFQPMVVMLLAFAALIVLGVFYGVGPLPEKLAALKGWRKLLLLPIAAALLGELPWKQRLTWALIGASFIGLLLSYAGFLGLYGSPIVLHNQATQGIFFAAGAFAAAVVMAANLWPERPFIRWGLGLGVLLLILNIIFITPGRGGYLAMLVLTVVATLGLIRGWRPGMADAGPAPDGDVDQYPADYSGTAAAGSRNRRPANRLSAAGGRGYGLAWDRGG